MLYRNFATTEDLDAEYNLSARVPESVDIAGRWAKESAQARKSLDCALGVRFGPTVEEYIDIFPAKGNDDAPVHMFAGLDTEAWLPAIGHSSPIPVPS